MSANNVPFSGYLNYSNSNSYDDEQYEQYNNFNEEGYSFNDNTAYQRLEISEKKNKINEIPTTNSYNCPVCKDFLISLYNLENNIKQASCSNNHIWYIKQT